MTLVVSHRGLGFDAPEHSLLGYERALASRADGIEVDLYLSRDGQLICIHDAQLRRTKGLALRIAELNSRQLSELGAVTLYQVLALLKDSAPGKGVLIEVKHPTSNGALTEYRLKDELAFFGLKDPYPSMVREGLVTQANTHWVALMSFSWLAVRRLVRLIPVPAVVQLLNTDFMMNLALQRLPAAVALGPRSDLVNEKPELLTRISSHERASFVWTVNDPKLMRECFKQQVTCLITDDPSSALQIRAEFAAI